MQEKSLRLLASEGWSTEQMEAAIPLTPTAYDEPDVVIQMKPVTDDPHRVHYASNRVLFLAPILIDLQNSPNNETLINLSTPQLSFVAIAHKQLQASLIHLFTNGSMCAMILNAEYQVDTAGWEG